MDPGAPRVILLLWWCLQATVVRAEASEAPPPAWRCEEPTWESEPGSSHGIFSSDLRMDCRLPLGATESTPSALQSIRSRVIALVEGRQVHAGPLVAEREGQTGVKYDVSHTVLEDGNPIQFREWVWINGKDASRLRYATESTEIEASGMAGYLKEVRFSADLVGVAPDAAARAPASAELRVTLRNAVRIERPWYALDLFFAPIAAKVSREKFLRLRETVLPLLSPG